MFDFTEEKFQSAFFAMPDHDKDTTDDDDDSGSGDDNDGGFS